MHGCRRAGGGGIAGSREPTGIGWEPRPTTDSGTGCRGLPLEGEVKLVRAGSRGRGR